MSKITIREKGDELAVINRLTAPETVNDHVYASINAGVVDGVLPVTIYKTKKETRLECSVRGLIPVSVYYSKPIARDEFLSLASRLVVLFQECDKSMLPMDNLDLQKDRIYIDAQTKTIRCILWPVVNNQLSSPAHLFLKHLPFDLVFDSREDSGFLKTYIDFFKATSAFSLNSFEKMIDELQGKAASSGNTLHRSTFTSGDTDHGTDIGGEAPESIAYDPFGDANIPQNQGVRNGPSGAVFCPKCGARNSHDANFCSHCAAPLNKSAAAPQPPDGTGKTIGFGAMGSGSKDGGRLYPCLVSQTTGEKTFINLSEFLIGRRVPGQSDCDMHIGNARVSRRHAKIISRGGHYYVVDVGSANGTFVNGRRMPVNVQTEIVSGAVIQFAQEKFRFALSVPNADPLEPTVPISHDTHDEDGFSYRVDFSTYQ